MLRHFRTDRTMETVGERIRSTLSICVFFLQCSLVGVDHLMKGVSPAGNKL